MPLRAKPVTPGVAEAVHAKVVPATLEVSATAVVLAPEQIVCVKGAFVTVGVGFTFTVTIKVLPEQPPEVGETVYVAVAGRFVLLVSV